MQNKIIILNTQGIADNKVKQLALALSKFMRTDGYLCMHDIINRPIRKDYYLIYTQDDNILWLQDADIVAEHLMHDYENIIPCKTSAQFFEVLKDHYTQPRKINTHG